MRKIHLSGLFVGTLLVAGCDFVPRAEFEAYKKNTDIEIMNLKNRPTGGYEGPEFLYQGIVEPAGNNQFNFLEYRAQGTATASGRPKITKSAGKWTFDFGQKNINGAMAQGYRQWPESRSPTTVEVLSDNGAKNVVIFEHPPVTGTNANENRLAFLVVKWK